jgi:hypothetical protein
MTDIVSTDEPTEVEVGSLVETIAEMARERADTSEPVITGTFALYPMTDGGVMFVTDVDKGPMMGINHTRITPGLMRAMNVLIAGGSKFAALKALRGGRREIESGKQ